MRDQQFGAFEVEVEADFLEASLGQQAGGLRYGSLGTGNTSLLWNAVPGRCGRAQYREDIAGAAWTDLPGTVRATGSTASKVDPGAGTAQKRFYRVVREP